jgi:hypothetical protein
VKAHAELAEPQGLDLLLGTPCALGEGVLTDCRESMSHY